MGRVVANAAGQSLMVGVVGVFLAPACVDEVGVAIGPGLQVLGAVVADVADALSHLVLCRGVCGEPSRPRAQEAFLMPMLTASARGELKGPATKWQPGLSPQAQQTETVQQGVPCSLRAKANAF